MNRGRQQNNSNSMDRPPPGGLDGAGQAVTPHAASVVCAGAAAVLFPSSRTPSETCAATDLHDGERMGAEGDGKRQPRHPTTTKGEKARQPAPRCSRLSVASFDQIEAARDEAVGFRAVGVDRGRVFIWVLMDPENTRDRSRKQSVRAIHRSSLVTTPSLGAREQ